MKTKLLNLIIILFPLWSFGQACGAMMVPLSIEDRVQESTQIVEGVITSSQSYWDIPKHNIYTLHTISVYADMLGNSASSIQFVTMGGQVGDLIQVTSSAASLQVGVTATFFLKESAVKLSSKSTLYELVGAAQGVIKYSKRSDSASDIFNKYQSITTELYPKIQRVTAKTFRTIQKRPTVADRTNTNAKALLATPGISSFSPTTATAGTQTVLTINGSNFGSAEGIVSFRNANDGGLSYTDALSSQIVSWTDTQIQVEIPWLAGTGTIQVTNSTAETGTSSADLTINYSHWNATTATTAYVNHLSDDDGNGGFTFVYHTEFDSSSAKQYFEEAYALWNCESNINFTFGGTTTTDETVQDDINVVRFDNGDELSSGVLGRVTTYYAGICGDNAVVSELDITWNDSPPSILTWYYGDGTPSSTQIDFKSIALHELGHAHQLGHVIDSNVVMHYSSSPGESSYNLGENDIDAALYTMGIFTQPTACTNAMSPQYNCCDDIVITTQPVAIGVEENENASFTVAGTDYDTIIWQLSTNNGSTWNDLSNDSTYSGVTGTTLSITNAAASLDGNLYRAFLNNLCDKGITTDEVNLYVTDYTLIPDANFEAALEALGYDDISGDGKVPTALISGLSSLTITSRGISDLTGIGDFVALKQLYASNNAITTVDFSNNTGLTRIELKNNNLSGALDFTAITNLDRLQIQENELTSLNITGLTRLQRLYAAINNFTEIDLSSNTSLKEVGLNDNNLSSLNLKNGNNGRIVAINLVDNSNLTCVVVSDIAFAEAEFTNIDSQTFFSDLDCRYTSIPDTNFEAVLDLLGYDDIPGDEQVPTALIENITSLNVDNGEISNFTGIGDFVALQTLIATENDFSSIDLSNLTQLKTLNLSNTDISSLDISSNVALEELRADNTGVLATITFGNNTALKSLYARNNALTSLDLSALTALEDVFVNDNDLSSFDFRNGNNNLVLALDATNNPNLNCILVDDASTVSVNFIVDATTGFSDTGYCLYTTISDTNFEAALEALGYDDISGDFQVPTALIEEVTTLDVNSENINDFTGLEAFVGLTSLNLSNNDIISIDISKNILLENLQINDCSALETLVFGENNELIDLSITGTLIESLNLSPFRLLTEVNVSSNNLFYLNMQTGTSGFINNFNAENNPNLNCILVDVLAVASNWDKDDHTNYSETYCRYTAIPDANFEAALEALGYDDISGDYQVPTALIENVTSLNVSSQSIVYLTGIEDFTALTVLYAGGNNLTSIDLSNLLDLEELVLSGNQLTAVDVSDLTKLTKFTAKINSIQTLDFTNNTLLEQLIIENNPTLTTLEISQNIALEVLDMSDCAVSSLDLSQMTQLNSFDASDNQIAVIDFSNNPLLFEVYLSGNPISSIDLSNQPVLQYFDAFNAELTYLNIQNGNNNNLDYFDITGNPNLTCVLVDNVNEAQTNLNNVDAQVSFSETYCRYTYIPDDNFEAALEALGYDDISGDDQVPTALIENVTSLNVTGNSISVLTGIEDFTALTILNAGVNNLTSIDVSNLLNLEELSVAVNQLTSIDVSNLTQLKKFWANINTIETLDFSNNTLLEVLIVQNNTTLTSLDVSQNSQLEYLDFSNCAVSSVDLSLMTQLTTFDAVDNEIAVIDFSNNPLIYEAYLSNNPVVSVDMSNQSALEYFGAFNAELTYLNIQNGNNNNLDYFDITGNPNLTCVLVDNVNEAQTSLTDVDAQVSFSETSCTDITLALKTFLQGAALNPNTGEEDLMRDDLRVADLLPTTSPYSDGLTCDTTVFDTTGSDAIVDWVWVELRDQNDASVVIAEQSALLQRDGDIVGVDGVSDLAFSVAEDNYYVMIMHRNHLGIRSANSISLSTTVASLDLTSGTALVEGGSNAVVDLGNGTYAILAGDQNADGQIQNTDINTVITLLGGSGYSEADMNMDGQIQNTDINNLMNPNLGKGEQF